MASEKGVAAMTSNVRETWCAVTIIVLLKVAVTAASIALHEL